METTNSKLIVVLGMHRSGTSAITRGLQVLGVYLGDHLMPPIANNNETGFWEDIDLNALNMELLSALGSDWHHLAQIKPHNVEALCKKEFFPRAVELLCQKVGSHPLFAFKDRTATLLPFWQAVFAELDLATRYLIAIRNPLDVAASLSKRDGFPQVKGLMLWAKYFFDALRGTQGQSRVFVSYDAMLENPKKQLARIATALDLPSPEDNPEALIEYTEKFLTPALRHNVTASERLADIEQVPPFINKLYQFLQQKAKDALPAGGWVKSEQRYVEFLPLLAYVNQLEQDREHALVERESALKQLTAAQIALDQTVEAHQALTEKHNQVLTELTNLRSQFEQTLAQITEQRDQLQSQYKAEQENALKLGQQLAHLTGQITSLNQAVHDKDVRINNLNLVVADREAQVAGLSQAVAELNGRINGLNQATAERDGQIARLGQELAQLSLQHDQLQGQYKAEHENALQLGQQLTHLTGQITSLNQAVRDKGVCINNLNLIVADRDGQINHFSQAIDKLTGQITSLNQAVHDKDVHIKNLDLIIADHKAQIGSFSQDMAERDGQIAALNQQMAQISGQHDHLQSQYKDAQHSPQLRWRMAISLGSAPAAKSIQGVTGKCTEAGSADDPYHRAERRPQPDVDRPRCADYETPSSAG